MVERSTWPSEQEVYEARRELHDLELNVAFVGRVQNYDPASQTATIIPIIREQIPREDGLYDQEELPPVPHVAILQPRTRGWGLSIPVQDGDTVLCVCLDGDATAWRRGRTSEGTHEVRDLRRHHLAHAVAIAGFYRYNEPLRNMKHLVPSDSEEARLVIGSDADEGARISIFGDGSVEIAKGSNVRLRIDADGTVHLAGAPAATKLLALAELVDARLNTLREAYNTHTHPTAPAGPVSPPSTPLATPLATTSATKTRGV